MFAKYLRHSRVFLHKGSSRGRYRLFTDKSTESPFVHGNGNAIIRSITVHRAGWRCVLLQSHLYLVHTSPQTEPSKGARTDSAHDGIDAERALLAHDPRGSSRDRFKFPSFPIPRTSSVQTMATVWPIRAADRRLAPAACLMRLLLKPALAQPKQKSR